MSPPSKEMRRGTPCPASLAAIMDSVFRIIGVMHWRCVVFLDLPTEAPKLPNIHLSEKSWSTALV